MYPEKTFTPDGFRLWVDPPRKAPPAFGDLPRKKYNSRQPLAFGQSPAKSPASLRRYAPKKRSRQTAFGFGSILSKKSRQRPEICPEKTLRPDGLRLLVNLFRKISPAARCDNPKKCSSRQPPALDQSFSKNLSSDPLQWPEKVQLQTASSFWSILFEKSLQRPAATTRKSMAKDRLRLLVDPFRKISPAACCDDPKKCSSRLPSTLDLY